MYAPTSQTEIKTFRLQYAAAEDVAETLREVLTGENEDRPPQNGFLGPGKVKELAT